MQPLHERLKSLRQSAFGSSGSSASSTDGKPRGVAGAAQIEASDPPTATPSPASGRTRVLTPGRGPSSTGAASPGSLHGRLQNPLAPRATSNTRSDLPQNVVDTFAAQRAAREAAREAARQAAQERRAAEAQANEPTPAPRVAGLPSREEDEAAEPEPVHSAVGEESAPEANPADDGAVLFTRQSPILGVQTHGPRRITVGKESAYEVVIHNTGQVAANELVVTVDLPSWADVLGAEVSTGATQSVDSAERSGQFQWRVGRLNAASQEKLVLRIVPRESRPFELGVRWSFTPIGSQAAIVVQEPKIELDLDGPREVVHGQKEVYKLSMANTGNGPAENLDVVLTPRGPGENVSASHKLGTLAAGEKKVIEVELTARQAGQLTIEVEVRGDGGLQASLSERITVRRAELSVDLKGPKVQYVGTTGTYAIEVSNPGSAAARNLRVSAALPEGAEHVTAAEGGEAGFDGRSVQWKVDQIAPGASRQFNFKCTLGRPGLGRIEVEVAADDGLTASGSLATQVEAMADLSLTVVDPAGPVPVGDEAVYEVRIQNRGSKSAQGVEAVAYFSHGIEPFAAEGAAHKVGPGQVVFSPIAAIPAGKTHVLRVKAKAEKSGNHVFRAEVYCRAVGSRLVSEETTRYFGEAESERSLVAGPRAAPETGERRSAGLRTADRGLSRSGEPTPAPARE